MASCGGRGFLASLALKPGGGKGAPPDDVDVSVEYAFLCSKTTMGVRFDWGLYIERRRYAGAAGRDLKIGPTRKVSLLARL